MVDEKNPENTGTSFDYISTLWKLFALALFFFLAVQHFRKPEVYKQGNFSIQYKGEIKKEIAKKFLQLSMEKGFLKDSGQSAMIFLEKSNPEPVTIAFILQQKDLQAPGDNEKLIDNIRNWAFFLSMKLFKGKPIKMRFLDSKLHEKHNFLAAGPGEKFVSKNCTGWYRGDATASEIARIIQEMYVFKIIKEKQDYHLFLNKEDKKYTFSIPVNKEMLEDNKFSESWNLFGKVLVAKLFQEHVLEIHFCLAALKPEKILKIGEELDPDQLESLQGVAAKKKTYLIGNFGRNRILYNPGLKFGKIERLARLLQKKGFFKNNSSRELLIKKTIRGPLVIFVAASLWEVKKDPSLEDKYKALKRTIAKKIFKGRKIYFRLADRNYKKWKKI
ncbi:hypothetical protein ACFL35_12555 [Candidatus Riflebacteria bacterium]